MTGQLRDALMESPGVAAAAGALDGGWVVGGAIRDALMGREVVDADIAVEAGAEEAAAKAIASAGGGHAFELSADHGTWRVVSRDRSWHVDVARLRGEGIDGDLALRDFTINAIALPLGALDSELLDPTGGRADIADRRLRAVSDGSFADDPLRLLRAARIAAGLDLTLDEGTASLARAASGRAGEPAGERQLAELRRLLGGVDPLRGLELLDEMGATAGVLPELEALKGVGQNVNHHLDVHGHTLEVLRQMLAIESDLETYAGADSVDAVRALLAEPLGDDFTRGDGLRFGALLHDTGKPATKGERDGYVTFIGHDSVGADIVDGAMARLQASRAVRRYVSGLTRHHLHLGFMVHERPLTRRRVFEYLSLCGDVAPDVTLLTAADRTSARGSGPVASAEMIEAHLELVREMLPDALEWQRSGPPALPIKGDELAREVGIAEGPQLGELIAELQAAIFAGEVSDRDEAVAHARRALA